MPRRQAEWVVRDLAAADTAEAAIAIPITRMVVEEEEVGSPAAAAAMPRKTGTCLVT